ncbi:unnamed protein product [Polarella glacialis]|uniref:RRM domain-containing protein n=1 Tax=Polarella glacialis TaxID=89957 RepID=A0A813KVT2_POLGL|nr:unnamed protein product [Polarella glacialis]
MGSREKFAAVRVKNTFLDFASEEELQDAASTPLLRQQSEPQAECGKVLAECPPVPEEKGVPLEKVWEKVAEESCAESQEEGVVTMMMRNLPNRYKQEMVREEVEKSGFSDAFDILYLPLDPKTRVNRGYAFINFKTALQASQFKATFDGYRMQKSNSHKAVSVVPAKLQGFDAVYAKILEMQHGNADLPCHPFVECGSKINSNNNNNDNDNSGSSGSSKNDNNSNNKNNNNNDNNSSGSSNWCGIKQQLSYQPPNEQPLTTTSVSYEQQQQQQQQQHQQQQQQQQQQLQQQQQQHQQQPQQRPQLQLHLLLNREAPCKARDTQHFCNNTTTNNNNHNSRNDNSNNSSNNFCFNCGEQVPHTLNKFCISCGCSLLEANPSGLFTAPPPQMGNGRDNHKINNNNNNSMNNNSNNNNINNSSNYINSINNGMAPFALQSQRLPWQN